ncbi:hypothetical protein B5X24_HaOG213989 [Helicoverpa armigera]|nr:hypothetical protein B5X24_HaOG213989 [Helicoverpa armigera]
MADRSVDNIWYSKDYQTSACWPAQPASLSRGGEGFNYLRLSSQAASPLRAYAVLNCTLGVGQTRLRGVGFAAIRFRH